MRTDWLIVDDEGTVDKLMKTMKKYEKRALSKIEEDQVDITFMFRDEVRKNAQGRPGPNKVTGAYWNSIFVLVKRQKKMFRKSTIETGVFTFHPAANRLESGFVGKDAMGRHYNQPPFQHWGPARETIAAVWASKSRETLIKAWKK